jgi:hypothetical protein
MNRSQIVTGSGKPLITRIKQIGLKSLNVSRSEFSDPKESRFFATIAIAAVLSQRTTFIRLNQAEARYVKTLRRTATMQTFLQDLKYALRMLKKNPAFTTVAILTLAVGIGANSAIFSVLNSVLLRPLPYRQPGELVRVYSEFPTMQLQKFWLSPPETARHSARGKILGGDRRLGARRPERRYRK